MRPDEPFLICQKWWMAITYTKDVGSQFIVANVQQLVHFRMVVALMLGIVASSIPSVAVGQAEAIYNGRPLSEWIFKLESGTPAEKRSAAVAITQLAPQRADVVDLLILAIDQRTDYELQTNAINALKSIGNFARKAVPALVKALGAPDIEDDSVREQAASALAVVAEGSPVELTIRLELESREAIIRGILRALGYLKASDPRTLAAIMNILEQRPDTADMLFERAVWTLGRLGESATPAIIERLKATKSKIAVSGLVASLGDIYFNLQGRAPPLPVVEALLVATRYPDDSVVRRAIRALQSANARSAVVADRLKEILGDDRTEAYLVDATAKASAVLFPQDTDLVRLTGKWLRTSNSSYDASIFEALRQYGSLSVPVVLELMHSNPNRDLLFGAARVFTDQRFANRDVVSALAQNLNHSDQAVVTATIGALAELTPASLEVAPKIAALVASKEVDARINAIETMGRLAQYMISNKEPYSNPRELKDAYLLALNAARTTRREDVEAWRDQTIRPLSVVVEQMTDRERFRLTVYLAIGSAALLAFLSFYAVSWRVRQWLQVLAGRRWVFYIGGCEFLGRVTASPEGLRISLRPGHEGQSAVIERLLPAPAITPTADMIVAFRSAISSKARVRIEVEEPHFAQPWAKFLVGQWQDPNGCIGGQIALVQQVTLARKHFGRQLRFRALASGRGDQVYGRLPMASVEAERVGSILRNWGADVVVHRDNAKCVDFIDALETADAVHISAHANFDRILFADGPFTTADLAHRNLASCRCRLLVLSACEAGDLSQRHALLWTFVRAGINVIAATRPVHDLVCQVLFEEFYLALLPRHATQGIDLASAIRSAVANTRTRLFSSCRPEDRQRVTYAFDQTIGSFVIFGDPSLSLQLVRPPSVVVAD